MEDRDVRPYDLLFTSEVLPAFLELDWICIILLINENVTLVVI